MSMVEHDLVIRGGTVVEGLGGVPFTADVAVRDGRIAEIGRVAGKGAEEIDAQGRIVTPGFVGIHTHYDGQLTWEQSLRPSAFHGVTTVVMGKCGVGFASLSSDLRVLPVSLMSGGEEITDVAWPPGIP